MRDRQEWSYLVCQKGMLNIGVLCKIINEICSCCANGDNGIILTETWPETQTATSTARPNRHHLSWVFVCLVSGIEPYLIQVKTWAKTCEVLSEAFLLRIYRMSTRWGSWCQWIQLGILYANHDMSIHVSAIVSFTLTFCLKCLKCDTMVAQRLLRDVFRSSVLLSIVSETELV